MPFRSPEDLLGDILASIVEIEQIVAGLDLKTFSVDRLRKLAVERLFQILTEAAVRLGDQAEPLCPDVNWRDIRGMGNWLRHAYEQVDDSVIWAAIEDDLPSLKATVQIALSRVDHNDRDRTP